MCKQRIRSLHQKILIYYSSCTLLFYSSIKKNILNKTNEVYTRKRSAISALWKINDYTLDYCYTVFHYDTAYIKEFFNLHSHSHWNIYPSLVRNLPITKMCTYLHTYVYGVIFSVHINHFSHFQTIFIKKKNSKTKCNIKSFLYILEMFLLAF